jgi:hypothetical protein
MIRRTFVHHVGRVIAFAAHGAGRPRNPALAACSKALVETLTKSETLPTYTVKAPNKSRRAARPELVHGAGAQRVDQDLCLPRLRARPRPRAKSFPQDDSGEELGADYRAQQKGETRTPIPYPPLRGVGVRSTFRLLP